MYLCNTCILNSDLLIIIRNMYLTSPIQYSFLSHSICTPHLPKMINHIKTPLPEHKCCKNCDIGDYCRLIHGNVFSLTSKIPAKSEETKYFFNHFQLSETRKRCTPIHAWRNMDQQSVECYLALLAVGICTSRHRYFYENLTLSHSLRISPNPQIYYIHL